MADEYGDMPHKRLKMLEGEIADLRSKKLSSDENVNSQELLNSMKNLSVSLNNIIDMFSSAATAMHVEEKEEKTIEPVMKKIDVLIEQNEKIASGILAVADMFREEIPKIHDSLRRIELARPMPMSSSMMPEPRVRQHMPSYPAPRMSGSGQMGANASMGANNPMGSMGNRPMAPRPEMDSSLGMGSPQMKPGMPIERPPMPPGLDAFEKRTDLDKKKSSMFGGLFGK